MKQIVAHYGQQGYYGYPEDSWDEESIVSNSDELFEFMRYCHLRDARNHNNYPLTSHWSPSKIQFYSREVEVCNLGHTHYGEETWIDDPDFLEESKRLYNEWVERINRTIPHLQEVSKRKRKEELEKREYDRLKGKYETH